MIKTHPSWLAQGWQEELSLTEKMAIGTVLLFSLWLLVASILSLLDPTAGLLDSGILTVFIFGLIAAWLSVYISFWLQELLWYPFKTFRKQFNYHFNQLTSWQQCILYFSVFFSLLFAVLKAVEIVF
ncbi:hypothetical protein [Sphingobacterium faecale]|uniref:CPBP family intramembrane metalloprotease n=1 Tax=Sphingobacterium faecale TaxID=2803775 RepID=A0ABS1QXR7_9SPHI|nr:hypothetical protein [Sphingobacterium faecale]MBL1407222.1 hypothetical protein [Sphingobacterium faecale]